MTISGEATDLFGGALDDFELVGRGGSGTVYRAVDRSLGRTVAVKILRTSASSDAHGVPAEALAQAKVSWHANVLTLHASGHSPDGSPFLVLEYASGGSLADRVKSSGPMPMDAWLRMGEELAGALAAAHDNGVIHCDVKPSNVLFAADGSARLADFGIARSALATTGTLDSIEGSLAFAPPELLDGQRPQPANDIYSLALTLWFAATGRQPFGAGDQSTSTVIARIHSEDIVFSEVLAGVPAPLLSLLDSCISGGPGQRPTAGDVQNAFARSRGASARFVKAGWQRGSAKRLRGVGAALLLVGLVGTVLAVSRQTDQGAGALKAPDLCGAYSRSIADREVLFNQVSADLEVSDSPREVIERLLVRYPDEFARTQGRFLTEASRVSGGVEPSVTSSQLSQLALAEVFRSLGGGKAFLFDGQRGSFDPAVLPTELREASRLVSESNSLAASRCPTVDIDLVPAKARMNSAIVSNLTDEKFIDGFFLDPDSLDVFDAATVTLMVSMARGFVESLLVKHWDWLVALGQRNSSIRSAIAVEFPDLLLAAAASSPDLLAILQGDEWRPYLVSGYQRSGPAARSGMSGMYGDQVTALGLEGG